MLNNRSRKIVNDLFLLLLTNVKSITSQSSRLKREGLTDIYDNILMSRALDNTVYCYSTRR